ncbi:MAG: TetR/AcrR family transcriptional regulator [Candidatus Binataceae bacterium]
MKHSSKGARTAKVVPLNRGIDTRERVLQVALALFADHGYRGTSLRDIARRIGIKAPSLLHHFPSKQQLYLAVLDGIFNGMEDAAHNIMLSPGGFHDQIRKAIADSIDFIARSPDSMKLLWKELSDESGVGRQVMKRRLPPLNAIAVNFIFRGQREGAFRPEIEPFHFVQSLNSITTGYFTTAAVVKRLWNVNMLDAPSIERRKGEVIDMVERTLFAARGPAKS